MPNLWANFSDILVKSPDVVYAEICSNDIARSRDPISLADDVFQFANCLLAHGVTTVVLGQVFFLEIRLTRGTRLSRILTIVSWRTMGEC